MIALAQGGAGLALVMCFALLRTRQIAAASILLSVQSGAVALTAVVAHRPLLAVPPLLLSGGIWLIKHRTTMLEANTAPIGGAKLGIVIGAVLGILCQSQGNLAIPSAIVLLSVLLAATRFHPLMHIIALVAVQNGVALAGSLVTHPVSYTIMQLSPALLPFACLVLPLPLAAGLLVPALLASHGGLAGQRLANPEPSRIAQAGIVLMHRVRTWLGWIDLAMALAVFAVTLIVPLDFLATVFGPLLGLDGVLRSSARCKRDALTLGHRSAALLQSACGVVAVCAPNLIVAWVVVLAAAAAGLLPVVTRRWQSAVLAFLAAGLALFGALLLPTAPSVPAYFSLFSGFTIIAAVVPDLAVVVVVLILRLASQAPWPPAVEALGISMALIALLACACLLIKPARPGQVTLLQLAQVSVAALSICLGQPDSRFAALVLLMLLILTRASARHVGGLAPTLALAGLGGIPPLGVFPGLVLTILAISAHNPWLLLPLGAALIPIASAAFPRHLPGFSVRLTIPSIAWLPLVLTILIGYCAPEQLVHWWRLLTIGRT